MISNQLVGDCILKLVAVIAQNRWFSPTTDFHRSNMNSQDIPDPYSFSLKIGDLEYVRRKCELEIKRSGGLEHLRLAIDVVMRSPHLAFSFLLERYRIQLEQQDSHVDPKKYTSRRDSSRNSHFDIRMTSDEYRSMVILIRSLYAQILLLPAHKIIRKFRHCGNSTDLQFKLDFLITSNDNFDLGFENTPKSCIFKSLHSSAGLLDVSIQYDQNCDFGFLKSIPSDIDGMLNDEGMIDDFFCVRRRDFPELKAERLNRSQSVVPHSFRRAKTKKELRSLRKLSSRSSKSEKTSSRNESSPFKSIEKKNYSRPNKVRSFAPKHQSLRRISQQFISPNKLFIDESIPRSHSAPQRTYIHQAPMKPQYSSTTKSHHSCRSFDSIVPSSIGCKDSEISHLPRSVSPIPEQQEKTYFPVDSYSNIHRITDFDDISLNQFGAPIMSIPKQYSSQHRNSSFEQIDQRSRSSSSGENIFCPNKIEPSFPVVIPIPGYDSDTYFIKRSPDNESIGHVDLQKNRSFHTPPFAAICENLHRSSHSYDSNIHRSVDHVVGQSSGSFSSVYPPCPLRRISPVFRPISAPEPKTINSDSSPRIAISPTIRRKITDPFLNESPIGGSPSPIGFNQFQSSHQENIPPFVLPQSRIIDNTNDKEIQSLVELPFSPFKNISFTPETSPRKLNQQQLSRFVRSPSVPQYHLFCDAISNSTTFPFADQELFEQSSPAFASEFVDDSESVIGSFVKECQNAPPLNAFLIPIEQRISGFEFDSNDVNIRRVNASQLLEELDRLEIAHKEMRRRSSSR